MAAVFLLDGGISLPFFTIFGRIGITMKMPVTSQIIKMNTLCDDLSEPLPAQEHTVKETLDYMSKNAVPISRMLAYMVYRGPGSFFLNRILAWLIRRHMTHIAIYEAAALVFEQINTAPFESITNVARTVNKLEPILGQIEKRS